MSLRDIAKQVIQLMPELPREAPEDVVAQRPVVHSLSRIERNELRPVNGGDGLGVLTAVQSGGTDDVAGAVKVGDALFTHRGRNDGLEDAAAD